MKLRGKVAIVTASTDGIGFGIAKKFVEEGCNVVVSSRRKPNVERAVRELEPIAKEANCQVIGLQCDVQNLTELQNLVTETTTKFGTVHILVANAAANPVYGKGLLDVNDADYDKTFNTNVKSTWQLCKMVTPMMEKQQEGVIIFVSSLSAYHMPAYLGAYAVSKAALIALAKSMASQLGKSNIRVNVISPGVIETRFSQAIRRDSDLSEMIISRIPLGRFGKSEDCAGAALFLATEDGAYITGESIIIAGGTPSRF